MSFHVICLETGEPISSDYGPILYDTGEAAAIQAREFTALTGKKHQPRPVKDDAWKAREAARLEDGTYTRVPWDNGICWFWRELRKPEAEFHFAHVALKHPGCIAFTENAAKGAADVQTPMKVGRYLERFYNLDGDSVRTFANQYLAKYGTLELRFAATEDDFEHVYTNGPSSCMSKAASYYESPVHPVRMYAAGDLQVAYLVAKDDGEHITSRVLCWPEKKTYGRVYGDDKIETMLDAEGWQHEDYFANGAKMLRQEADDGRLIVPYVDGVYRADDCGTYLRIAKHGDIDCETTTGLSGFTRHCDHCGDGMSEDEGCWIDSRDENWCEHCAEHNAFYCDDTGTMIAHGDGVEMANGDYWSQRRFDRQGFTCDATGENHDSDDLVSMANGECWCREHFEHHGWQCDDCGDCYENGEKCPDCEDSEQAVDSDGAPIPQDHKPRQGRDEHPNQLEMVLPQQRASVTIDGREYRAEDVVELRNTGFIELPDGFYRIDAVDPNDTQRFPIKVRGYWIRPHQIFTNTRELEAA